MLLQSFMSIHHFIFEPFVLKKKKMMNKSPYHSPIHYCMYIVISGVWEGVVALLETIVYIALTLSQLVLIGLICHLAPARKLPRPESYSAPRKQESYRLIEIHRAPRKFSPHEVVFISP